ncbi:MAG: hypothetical protein AB1638_06935 [Nitrospirota bacterium]
MRKKQLLFVTYNDEDFGEGLPYALYLAKMLNKSMNILLIYRKKIAERFENLMTAVTFAEASEHKTARQILTGHKIGDERITPLLKNCEKEGVDVDVFAETYDAISSIKTFLRQKPSVDMVLLNSNIINHGSLNTKELNRLVHITSMPVVTITKEACVRHRVNGGNLFINNGNRGKKQTCGT